MGARDLTRVSKPDPLPSRPTVELQLRRGCGAYTTAARTRLPRNGRFRVRLRTPRDAATIVLRARIRLPGARAIYSLPRTITGRN